MPAFTSPYDGSGQKRKHDAEHTDPISAKRLAGPDNAVKRPNVAGGSGSGRPRDSYWSVQW